MSLVAFFTVGLLWGFLETFLFWFLDDLGAGHTLMGLSMAVATLTGLPVQFYATFLIKRVGHQGLAILALTCMAIRCMGYSYLTDTPSLFLLYETLKPMSTTLIIISTFDFIRLSVPITTYATVNSIFGAMYFGVGRGLGGLFGGYAISDLGFRLAFQVFAAVAMVVAVVFGIVTSAEAGFKNRSAKT